MLLWYCESLVKTFLYLSNGQKSMDKELSNEEFEQGNNVETIGVDPLLQAAFEPEGNEDNLINVDKPDKASSEYELSFDDVVEYLEHILRGHSKNNKTGEWNTDDENEFRLLNDRGIQDLKYAMMAVGNRNVFLSNIPEDKVYYFVRTLRIDVATLLAYNWKEYGAKKQYLSYILDLIVSVISSAFFRCMDGGERKIRKENVLKRYSYGVLDRGEKKKDTKSGVLSYLGL